MTFEDAVLNKYYQQFMSETDGLPTGGVDYTPITVENKTTDELRSQIAASIRPAVDQSIDTLKTNVVSQRASADADAASRGMGRSTWLSDVKSRLSQSEQANVASIETNYGANLSQQVMTAWQNQQNLKSTIDAQNASNKMNVDQFKAEKQTEREQTAYERAQYAAAVANAAASSSGSRSGSGSTSGYDDITENQGAWVSYSPPRTGAALYRPGEPARVPRISITSK